VVNPKLAMQIHKRDNFICQYCGKDMLRSVDDWSQMVIDRFKAKNKNRLVTSCQLCDRIKGKETFSNMQEARGFVMMNRIQLQKAYLRIRKRLGR